VKLAHELAEAIKAHGPLPVADYMARCNAHYYASHDPFGTKGDFITAPEISQIFGELIGAWLANLALPRAMLCELGPGRGTLMKDALRATRKGFHESLASVRLIETSPLLRRRQQETLKGMHPSLEWRETLEGLPPMPLLLIANEFFDALPVEQYVSEGHRETQRRVGHDGSGFRFTPEGSVTREASPESLEMVKRIASHIAQFGGAALIIDYGYHTPLPLQGQEESKDTLQAVKRHAYASPLGHPGEADLTAHVDFSALARAAQAAGAYAHGPVAQGTFLKRLGAELRAAALCKNAKAEQRDAILSGLERLVAPQAMGELFKVLAVTHEPGAPAGF